MKDGFFNRKKTLDVRASAGSVGASSSADDGAFFVKMLPSIVTLFATVLGLTSVRCALAGDFYKSIVLITCAALLDGVDGRLARALNSCSVFGGELDSLADVINFGVCSPLIMYIWAFKKVKFFGWGVCLLFTACMQIRLARFNSISVVPSADHKVSKAADYFYGIPAPMAALLNLLPLILFYEMNHYIKFELSCLFVRLSVVWCAIISFLAVSRVPTFSLKTISINKSNSALVLAAVSVFIICYTIDPMKTVLLIAIAYIFGFPLVLLKCNKCTKG